jgi:hypothetical protein
MSETDGPRPGAAGGEAAALAARRARAERLLPRFNWLTALTFWPMTAAVIAMVLSDRDARSWSVWQTGLLLGLIPAMIGALGFTIALRSNVRQIDQQLAAARTDSLQNSLEEDFFTKLVKINFKYIDQYYLQTQEQADKSFLLSAIVALAGFGVLVVGVVLLYVGRDVDTSRIVVGAGVLSEFIAAVFFYLYNRTILKMGEYHQKLVLTQNVSLALKIAESLPDDARVAAQSELVRQLSSNVNAYLVSAEAKE